MYFVRADETGKSPFPSAKGYRVHPPPDRGRQDLFPPPARPHAPDPPDAAPGRAGAGASASGIGEVAREASFEEEEAALRAEWGTEQVEPIEEAPSESLSEDAVEATR